MPCPICDEKPINCQCTKAEIRMHYEIEELEEKVPRWIPVSERLPEMGVYVAGLWLGLPETSSPGERVRVVKRGVPEWYLQTGVEMTAPTHWMPLPEPPEVN